VSDSSVRAASSRGMPTNRRISASVAPKPVRLSRCRASSYDRGVSASAAADNVAAVTATSEAKAVGARIRAVSGRRQEPTTRQSSALLTAVGLKLLRAVTAPWRLQCDGSATQLDHAPGHEDATLGVDGETEPAAASDGVTLRDRQRARQRGAGRDQPAAEVRA